MNNNWRGKFGDEYTKRNDYDWTKRIPTFKHILNDIKIKDILEVGSNCGKNLLALEQMGYSAMGIEPNTSARKEAQGKNILTFPGTADDIPFGQESFDLVFTCGVLIHVPPNE
jgi:SAM-dependent methyltransferase